MRKQIGLSFAIIFLILSVVACGRKAEGDENIMASITETATTIAQTTETTIEEMIGEQETIEVDSEQETTEAEPEDSGDPETTEAVTENVPETTLWSSQDLSAWNLCIPGYDMPYYIRINVTCNVVNIYANEGDGNYVPYTAFLTSCGTYTLHEGVFPLSDHYEWRELYGGAYGHYAVRIYSGLLFHSVPCSEMSLDTMDMEAYAALGTTASLGCMRLKDEDAKWIYENCAAGTLTEFYEDEQAGPFGKPAL